MDIKRVAIVTSRHKYAMAFERGIANYARRLPRAFTAASVKSRMPGNVCDDERVCCYIADGHVVALGLK